jgi:glucose uptake protein
MFIISHYPLAVVVCFLTMLCWGSWANTQKLATQSVPTTIFYRDYTYGILIMSLLLAFTLGSIGSLGRSFLTDFKQADTQSTLFALIGGFVFNIANVLIVVGIELAGLSVAMPVGIGLALILGVVVNYILSPVGNISLLSGGVFSIFLAIVFSALAHRAKSFSDESVSPRGLVISLVGGFLFRGSGHGP